MNDWWFQAFTLTPPPSTRKGHPCGQHQMLTVIAYDITNHRRLQKIAKFCENYGVRVQYSVFECRLEADRFDEFWRQLEELIDPKTDRLVAYKICLNCARDILTAGTMQLSNQPIAYVF